MPLLSFPEALERTVARSGLSRQEWLARLARFLDRPALLPLLWLLPRGWRLAPAHLPPRLRALAGVLERGLLTPTVLTALADDLPHLAPVRPDAAPEALALWADRLGPEVPRRLEGLLALTAAEPSGHPAAGMRKGDEPSSPTRRADRWAALTGGLEWGNQGLGYEQNAAERERNRRCARALNRLGANLLGGEEWTIDGCRTTADLVSRLASDGWRIGAQLRCGVTSFGLGAALRGLDGVGWSQVPLALPMRTGLLDGDGVERVSLLPHCCLEMEWRRGVDIIRLQYYQGIEGLCGWEALNDLCRPWQNDRHNGTLHYFGERYGRPLDEGPSDNSPSEDSLSQVSKGQDGEGEPGHQRLRALMDLGDGMALVHNVEANERHLSHGGYGPLGLCIDSAALLQQSLEGRCQVFPVLLGGIWRERLSRRCQQVLATAPLSAGQRQGLESYQRALAALPYDGFLRGASATEALGRLRTCQPRNSPFLAVQALAAK